MVIGPNVHVQNADWLTYCELKKHNWMLAELSTNVVLNMLPQIIPSMEFTNHCTLCCIYIRHERKLEK